MTMARTTSSCCSSKLGPRPAQNTFRKSNTRRDAYNPILDMHEAHLSRQTENEYGEDVMVYMYDLDSQTRPDVNMMDTQPEIEWTMRPYLLDFLIDTHLALRLEPETLFLAINLVDRYCSKRVVYRKHYQLVGCTGLWIASKYEDKKRRVPSLKELCHMCCNTYDSDMFVQMERHVLNTLNWTVGHPTTESFLKAYLGSDHSPTVKHIAQYLCELAQFSRDLVQVPGSTLAAAAYTLAMHIVGCFQSIPPNTNEAEMQCISMLCSKMDCPSKSLQRKYSSTTLSQAYLLASNFVSRQHYTNLALPPTPPPNTPPLSCPTSASSVSSRMSYASSDTTSIFEGDFSQVQANVTCYMTPPRTPSEVAEAISAHNGTEVIVGSLTQSNPIQPQHRFESVVMEYSH